MRLYLKTVFLTLVLIAPGLIQAAPDATLQEPKKNMNPKQNSANSQDQIWKESLQQAETGAVSQEMLTDPLFPTRFRTDWTHSVSLGVWYGSLYVAQEIKTSVFAQYTLSRYLTDKGQEITAEITQEGDLGWSFGHKWLYTLGEYSEPYWKISLGALYVPSENLATFINWRRYQVRGAVGFDDLLKLRRQLRTEFAVIWSGLGLSSWINFSYTF